MFLIGHKNLPPLPSCHIILNMPFNSPPQQSEPLATRVGESAPEASYGDSSCRLVSRECLEALGFDADDEQKQYLTPSKSCNSLAASSEDSTHALTDCSSRTSLQDLDLSFEESLPSPALGYWKPVEDDVRKGRHPFLPSVLRKPPQTSRVVSFSSVEVVFGGEEQLSGMVTPKTPSIDWYASRGASQTLHESRQHESRQHVPVYSSESPHRKPPLPRQQQPRRSALKKPDSRTREASSPFQFPSLHQPYSPKITWYSSKK